MSSSSDDLSTLTQKTGGGKFVGHRDSVWSVAIASDGRLASAGSDGTVRIWSPNCKSLAVLEGHRGWVRSVAFDIGGRLASAGSDGTVRIWGPNGEPLALLEGHRGRVWSVAFASDGRLASAGSDGTVRIWAPTGESLAVLEGHRGPVEGVAFARDGRLASAGDDRTVRIWARDYRNLAVLEGHLGWVRSVAFASDGRLASAGSDGTVRIWSPNCKSLAVLEGHRGPVQGVAFAGDGRLASASDDRTIRIWAPTGESLAVLHSESATSVAFAENGHIVSGGIDGQISIWDPTTQAIDGRATRVQTAKVVLLGDRSVGKSTLGTRIVTGKFEPQPSTHRQRAWLVQPWRSEQGGVQRQVFLWDLAGQADYRIVNALFVDDAHVALVLFEAGDRSNPLGGPQYWARLLPATQRRILIAAKAEQGNPSITSDELTGFCRENGFDSWLVTDSMSGHGIRELERRVLALLPWNEVPVHTAELSWQKVREQVIALRNADGARRLLFGLEEIRVLTGLDDAGANDAIDSLQREGFVLRIRDSGGGQIILLMPEMLNNLMASVILRARSGQHGGPGTVEEQPIVDGSVPLAELPDILAEERPTLLQAALATLQEKRLCFREERDGRAFLVFPQLVDDLPTAREALTTIPLANYVAVGRVEHLYAVAVVRLQQTGQFASVRIWTDQARFTNTNGEACVLRRALQENGKLQLEVACTANTPRGERRVFTGLVESILEQRKERMDITCFDEVVCSKCEEQVDFATVQRFFAAGKGKVSCPDADCATPVAINGVVRRLTTFHDADPGIQASVDRASAMADLRSRFDQACSWLSAMLRRRDGTNSKPTCFIMYAWSDPKLDERTRTIARDMRAGGVDAKMDWYDSHVGNPVVRFSEMAATTSFVACVGTPAFRRKHGLADGGTAQQEWLLVSERARQGEARMKTILPLLIEGEGAAAFPDLLQALEWADLRSDHGYFAGMFDVLLKIHGVDKWDSAVDDLRASLRAPYEGPTAAGGA